MFEPADPRRTMPRSLVIGAVVAAVLLIALMSFLNRRSLEEPDQNATINAAASSEAATPQPAAPPAPATPAGAVVLTATAPAWVSITDQGKTLFQGELQPGQAYTVPATATAPMLKAGKPEALKVTVGTTVAPQVGPAGKVTTVSLAPASLLKGPAVAPPPAAAQPAPATTDPAPRPRATRAPAPAAPPPAIPPPPQPVTNSQ